MYVHGPRGRGGVSTSRADKRGRRGHYGVLVRKCQHVPRVVRPDPADGRPAAKMAREYLREYWEYSLTPVLTLARNTFQYFLILTKYSTIL